MKKYKQLNYEERVTIKICLWKKMSINEIAKYMERSPSTISREIKRGITIKGTYFADSTERQTRHKKLNHKRKRKMSNPTIYNYVLEKLKDKQSPHIIQHDIEKDIGLTIGKDAIYDFIYRYKQEWTKYLKRKHKWRKKMKKNKSKKTLIPNRINISERPIEAEKRLEFGHFEADTIFSCRGSKSALLVISDRLTRKVKIKKLARKSSTLTSSSIVLALSDYNTTQIHTITYDNGCEFVGHEKVNKKLKCKSYFCNPYHSWEKGTVENINWFIRWHFPKGTNFDNITDEEIQHVEDWFNNRSMKILNWLSPNQMYEILMSVAV